MKSWTLVKITLLITVLSLFVSLAVFSQEKPKIRLGDIKEAKKQLKDGTYEGKSFKFPGAMIVSVTIKNGKIVEIKVLKHKTIQKYTTILGQLIDKIIKTQTTQVDGVTGASLSSNALKKAVDDALDKATVITEEK